MFTIPSGARTQAFMVCFSEQSGISPIREFLGEGGNSYSEVIGTVFTNQHPDKYLRHIVPAAMCIALANVPWQAKTTSSAATTVDSRSSRSSICDGHPHGSAAPTVAPSDYPIASANRARRYGPMTNPGRKRKRVRVAYVGAFRRGSRGNRVGSCPHLFLPSRLSQPVSLRPCISAEIVGAADPSGSMSRDFVCDSGCCSNTAFRTIRNHHHS